MSLLALANFAAASEYLYVLDSANDAVKSQILALDLASGEVVRSFQADYKADFAVAPDGNHLYVASSALDESARRWTESLDVFDTRSGRLVAKVQNPDLLRYTTPYYPSAMQISSSGRWVFVLKNRQEVGVDHYHMAIFDTAKEVFLPTKVELPGCRSAVFVPVDETPTVDAACVDSVDVLRISVDPTGAAPVKFRDVTQVSNPLREVVRGQARQGFSSLITDAASGNVIYAIGRDSPLLSGPDQFDQLVIARKNTLAPLVTSETGFRFYSMTVSVDATKLFAVSTEAARIAVFDASNLRQINVIHGVGRSPVFARAAPAPQ